MATSDTVDLVIVNPGAAHGIYGVLGEKLIAVEPPVWCRIIAAYARDRGYSVKIIDGEAHQDGARVVAAVIAAYAPRLVCIAVYGHQPSASTQQMHGAGALARAIKEIAPGLPVIMVGGHVSALPERTMREEMVDYCCVGEGPQTVVGLLAGEKPESIPGLVWRAEGEFHFGVQVNPAAPLSNDLSAYHGDAWDLLPMDRYRAHNWQCFGDLDKRQPYASIYTSLQCPFSCSFCCINAPFGGSGYRTRKPTDVVAEIVKLYRYYGISTLKIVDEMFVLKPSHYIPIAKGLIASGIADKLNIWAYARVDTVKPENLDLLRSAGIKWLALGIESGSAYVRDGAQKRLKEDDIEGVVRAIQKAGINVIGNFIVGLPDDTLATMEETYQLAARLNCEFMNVYSAQAYPGSPLYQQAIREGWTLPETWKGYSQHNEWCRPIDTKHVSAKEVLAFRDAFFVRYFSRPEYAEMILRRFGPEAATHVENMLKYSLNRRLLTGELAA